MQLLSPFIIMYFWCCAIEWTLPFKKCRDRCKCSKFTLQYKTSRYGTVKECRTKKAFLWGTDVFPAGTYNSQNRYERLYSCYKNKFTTLKKELYRLCVYRQRPAIYNPKINNPILSDFDFASGCSSVHWVRWLVL